MWLSPEEIRAIARLPKLDSLELESVYIGDSETSDSVLPFLRKTRGLKKLKIDSRDYSQATIDALQTALPKLIIELR